MTTATLSRIGTPSEPMYENNLVFIDLAFTDHESATLTTNEQGKASRLADLNALLNKPAEWNFGTNSKGKPTVKIHKADGFGGGGKKGGWQPTSVEERAEHLAMSAMKAVAHLAAAEMAALGPESVPEAARKKSLEFAKVAMRELVGTATGLLKASGTEGPSVSGKGAAASSVPDEPSGASDPLDAIPDRGGDGTTKPQEPPSADQPYQGGAVSSRHVHEWKPFFRTREGAKIPARDGWTICQVCGNSRPANDPEVVSA